MAVTIIPKRKSPARLRRKQASQVGLKISSSSPGPSGTDPSHTERKSQSSDPFHSVLTSHCSLRGPPARGLSCALSGHTEKKPSGQKSC